MAVVSFLLLAGVILAAALQWRAWEREPQAVPIPIAVDPKR